MRTPVILPSGSYQLLANSDVVIRLTDGVFIPADLNNKDRIAYQAWLDAGNTPVSPPSVVTPITSLDFFNRFTDDEKAAIWAASTATPQVGVGLTHGLASGQIDLTNSDLIAWMNLLVSLSVITSDRMTTILTP